MERAYKNSANQKFLLIFQKLKQKYEIAVLGLFKIGV